ncbi:HIT family protein [Candidatus Pacearchaeota archaeon]|nr:HIT family protein [Candidatus Pacearchaeota archaeon]
MGCDMCNALHQEYRIVAIDDYCFSIVNAFPLKDGHVMILPKRHLIRMSEFSEREAKSMLDMIDGVSLKLRNKYNQGIIKFVNGDEYKTQEHFHIHLLPSKAGLRSLISSYENVPEREKATIERLEATRNYINGL